MSNSSIKPDIINETRSEMIKESSYGIIPLIKRGGVWNVLLVKHHSGDHWSFPKGRPNPGESPREAAIRELHEETGLEVKQFLSDEVITEKYTFNRNHEYVKKSVTYYIAEVKGDVFLQFEEICGGKWVPLFEAQTHITYPEAQSVCQQVLSLFEKF